MSNIDVLINMAENLLQCQCGSISWAVVMKAEFTEDARLLAVRCEDCAAEIPLSDQVH